MKKTSHLQRACWPVLLMLAPAMWAQDAGSTGQSTSANAPQAADAANPTINRAENPPISGLDAPSFEPESGPKNFWQPGLHLSETADSNVQDTLGSGAFKSVTRALGSLALQREWSREKLVLEYEGGVGYYNSAGIGVKSAKIGSPVKRPASRILSIDAQGVRVSLNVPP